MCRDIFAFTPTSSGEIESMTYRGKAQFWLSLWHNIMTSYFISLKSSRDESRGMCIVHMYQIKIDIWRKLLNPSFLPCTASIRWMLCVMVLKLTSAAFRDFFMKPHRVWHVKQRFGAAIQAYIFLIGTTKILLSQRIVFVAYAYECISLYLIPLSNRCQPSYHLCFWIDPFGEILDTWEKGRVLQWNHIGSWECTSARRGTIFRNSETV